MRALLLVLVLLAPIAQADSILDQGTSLVEQGRSFLRGDDGVLLRKAWGSNDPRAYQIILDRANHGNDIAQNLMGVVFDTGRFGQHKSPEKALAWFNKSALSDNFVALYNLGILYSNGRVPGLKVNSKKAAKAFEMVYETRRGKAIPQDIIWLADYYYNSRNYSKSMDLCSRLTTQKWVGYTDTLQARMLLEGTAPEGRNPQKAINLLNEALNHQNMEAASLLLWIYRSQNNDLLALSTEMIMHRSLDTRQAPASMSENDIDQARNMARLWIENHGTPEVLDFESTITGFEAWIP